MNRGKIDFSLVALAFLVLIIGIYLIYQLNQQTVSIETEATVFLAILTGFYVFFTYILMNETRKQRMQSVQPAFALEIEINGVRVKNVGNGPAMESTLTLTQISGKGEERSILARNQDVPVGDSVFFAQDEFQAFGGRLLKGEQFGETLALGGKYTDTFLREQQIKRRTYDLTEYQKRMESQMIDSTDDSQISKDLSTISSAIDSFVTNRKFERMRDEYSIVKEVIDRAGKDSDE